jgi:RNA polymerase sigma factor (sigma-70 family)
MSIPVDRPPLHAIDESRPSDQGTPPLLPADPGAEPALHDQNWLILASYLNNAFLSELRRFAYRTTHNFEDAEDVVSDALVNTANAFHRLKQKTPASVANYIRRTIQRLAIDLARRNRCKCKWFPPEHALDVSDAHDSAPSPEPEPSQQTHFDAEDHRIVQALAAIPQASRRVAIMRFLFENEVPEIAQKLDIRPRTVRKHLEIARKVFKQHFSREGGTHGAE